MFLYKNEDVTLQKKGDPFIFAKKREQKNHLSKCKKTVFI